MFCQQLQPHPLPVILVKTRPIALIKFVRQVLYFLCLFIIHKIIVTVQSYPRPRQAEPAPGCRANIFTKWQASGPAGGAADARQGVATGENETADATFYFVAYKTNSMTARSSIGCACAAGRSFLRIDWTWDPSATRSGRVSQWLKPAAATARFVFFQKPAGVPAIDGIHQFKQPVRIRLEIERRHRVFKFTVPAKVNDVKHSSTRAQRGAGRI